MTEGPQLKSTSDAARSIGVARSTLWRWIKEGWLEPHHRTAGGHIRWDVARLRAEVEEHQRQSERHGFPTRQEEQP